MNPDLTELIGRLYPEQGAHGREHAQACANLTQEISHEPEYAGFITDDDRFLVGVAALLHDAGYPDRRFYWSGTQEEHPFESARRAVELLREHLFFTEQPNRLKIVAALILNHDNTNYTFPDYKFFESRRKARSCEPSAQPSLLPGTIVGLPGELGLGAEAAINEFVEVSRFIALLQILQEADSRLGNAERTLTFCQSRGIPITANDSGMPGVGMLMWQYSGLANVILALNRGLRDAYTQTGQKIAWQMFCEGREFVRSVIEAEIQARLASCSERGRQWLSKQYPPDLDNLGELLRYKDVATLIWGQRPKDRWRYPDNDDFFITNAISLEGVRSFLRTRLGQRVANVASRLVNVADIEVASETNTLLFPRKAQTLSLLRSLLITNYAWDFLTSVSGILGVTRIEKDPVLGDEREDHILIPPVLRTRSGGLQGINRPPYDLVNGWEWVKLAKDLGLPKIRVLFV